MGAIRGIVSVSPGTYSVTEKRLDFTNINTRHFSKPAQ